MNHFKREKGIYYTPKSIACYLTEKALLYSLRDKDNDGKIDSFEQLLKNYHERLPKLAQRVNSIKIVDPACGTGVFLNSAFELLSKLKFKIARLKRKSKEIEDLEKVNLRRQIIFNNLYGIDTNENAIKTAQHSLLENINDREEKLEDLYSNIIESIQPGNSILKENVKSLEAFDWNEKLGHIMKAGGFDIILGNPPWGARLNNIREYLMKEFPLVAQGQFDSYAVFLYMALRDLLKEDGILAFVLPNELCFLDQYISLRRYLLQSKIYELINLGFNIFDGVQKPALLLIIQKSSREQETLHKKSFKNKILISTGISEKEKEGILKEGSNLQQLIEKHSYFRDQKSFRENENFIFDIFADLVDREIKEKIQSSKTHPLKYYFVNGRGIDTNKSGRHFICPECDFLNPPFGRGHSGRIEKKVCNAPDCTFTFHKDRKQKYEKVELISEDDFPKEGYNVPCFIGEDLHKLHFSRNPRAAKYYGDKVNSDSHSVRKKYFKYSGIHWGKHELYTGERLLIRKVSTGHNLQVMKYDGFLVTNQQIYIIKKKPQFQSLDLNFVLGILASRLIHYYYIKQFGDPDKNILPHFTQANIKSLPIPFVKTKDKVYKNIIKVTKQLITLISKYLTYSEDSKKDKKEQYMGRIKVFYKKLDNFVFSLYNIKNRLIQQEIVKRANKNGFSLL